MFTLSVVPEQENDFLFGDRAIMMQTCNRFAVEFECFVAEDTIETCVCDDVVVQTGMGLNQVKIITGLDSTLSGAVGMVQTGLHKIITTQWYFSPTRPDVLQRNYKVWHQESKTQALRAALQSEARSYKCSELFHHRFDRITGISSVFLRIGGSQLDVFGDAGAFLVDFFNNSMVSIVHRMCCDRGVGFDYLNIWSKFTRPERLPDQTRWFGSGAQMIAYIEALPRLIRKNANNVYEPLFGSETQCIDCSDDLETLWWHASPHKGNCVGEGYIQLRLPAMSPDLLSRYLSVLADITEVALDWFYYNNWGSPVETMEDAQEAFILLHKQFPRYIPPVPLDKRRWLNMVHHI